MLVKMECTAAGGAVNVVEKTQLTQGTPVTFKTKNGLFNVILYSSQTDFNNNNPYMNVYSICVKDGVLKSACDQATRFTGSGYDASTQTVTINLSTSAGYVYGLFGTYE